MKSNENRRDALRKIVGVGVVGGTVAGGAQLVPTKWTKPVIDSVILPAHAAASGEVNVCGGGINAQTVTFDPKSLTQEECNTTGSNIGLSGDLVTITVAGGPPNASIDVQSDPAMSSVPASITTDSSGNGSIAFKFQGEWGDCFTYTVSYGDCGSIKGLFMLRSF